MALTFLVGALPFLFIASAHAQEMSQTQEVYAQETQIQEAEKKTSQTNPWLDDYNTPVGLTYGFNATLQTTYIWRGQYSGGLNIQPSANVGYGGLYVDLWWNIGTPDWNFNSFQPELDLSLGFNRWGLDVHLLYIHNFNCGFFDFNNYPDKGNRLEINARYTISSKLPLSFLWATRIGASDGYVNAAGDPIMAYSSYAEISYTQALPYGLSLYGAFGITPWRSCYTQYELGFAVQNIEVRLRKDWSIHKRLGLMLQGVFTCSPSMMAADKTTTEWHPKSPGRQAINANLALGIYLK